MYVQFEYLKEYSTFVKLLVLFILMIDIIISWADGQVCVKGFETKNIRKSGFFFQQLD